MMKRRPRAPFCLADPLRRAVDQRYRGFAGTAGRITADMPPCTKGAGEAKQAPQGRLAQLVRASRLHREGREFESLAAYQPSRLTGYGWASHPFAAVSPRVGCAQGEGCHAEARRAQADLLLSIPVLSIPGAGPKP